MKIHVYSICWNEADMLWFYFKNLERLSPHYVIVDDGSTDGTLDTLRTRTDVEIRPFTRTSEDSFVESAQELQNSVWKESRGKADWVILTAIDEHLCHANLIDYLARCQARGITAIPALGYQMISDTFPTPTDKLSNLVTTGVPFAQMNKLSIFCPDAIRETNFSRGRHIADPVGEVVLPARDEVLNLHYKYLDFKRLVARHKTLERGLGPKDKQKGWGHRYSFSERDLARDWAFFKSRAIDLSELGEGVSVPYDRPLWWRKKTPAYRVADV